MKKSLQTTINNSQKNISRVDLRYFKN